MTLESDPWNRPLKLILESDPINPPPAVNPRGQESNDPKVIDLLGGGGGGEEKNPAWKIISSIFEKKTYQYILTPRVWPLQK